MSKQTILGYEVPPRNRHNFTTYPWFQTFVKQQSANEWGNNKGQYLAILISQIEDDRANLPRMRLHYDMSLETLIIKFITVHHDIAATGFRETFLERCRTSGYAARGYLVSLRGSSHRSIDGQRLKEPDDAFKPKTARSHVSDKPTMVVEVRMEDSTSQLRTAAHHWLTGYHGEVWIVILIHVQRYQRSIRFENWQL